MKKVTVTGTGAPWRGEVTSTSLSARSSASYSQRWMKRQGESKTRNMLKLLTAKHKAKLNYVTGTSENPGEERLPAHHSQQDLQHLAPKDGKWAGVT